MFKNFEGMTPTSPLKVYIICLELPSTYKDRCFRFAVCELSEFNHIIKLGMFSTLKLNLLLTGMNSNTLTAEHSTVVQRILRINSYLRVVYLSIEVAGSG